jgi:hypothetical protein
MTTARCVRCALLALGLLLASAPDSLARPRVSCVTIHADETVPSVAQRLTGNARNMQAPWFQIVNPTTARRVPKARYGLLFAGWNACMVDRPIEAAAPEIEPAALSISSPSVVSSASVAAVLPSHPVARTGSMVVVWAPAVAWGTLVLVFSLTCWVVDEYLAQRALRLRAMKDFAERFVQEFERPLVLQHLPRRPIESRVRFRPGRSRFDVLLAPQGGLRYPNLTDHKRNVMYDVVRIQQALSEHAFVSSRPYARGRWVVVPFRFRESGRVRESGRPGVEMREAGDKCGSFS